MTYSEVVGKIKITQLPGQIILPEDFLIGGNTDVFSFSDGLLKEDGNKIMMKDLKRGPDPIIVWKDSIPVVILGQPHQKIGGKCLLISKNVATSQLVFLEVQRVF